MSALDDKILGEKSHCYCSSSSDSGSASEEESRDEAAAGPMGCQEPGSGGRPSPPYKWRGISTNTGPKGVIKDWQRFKQLETEKRSDQESERAHLIKKLTLSGRDEGEGDSGVPVDEQFLVEYRKERMREMLSTRVTLPTFGRLVHLGNDKHFLDAIDKEHDAVTIVIHIYEDRLSTCRLMNTALSSLAPQYPHVKFCRLRCSSAGMSHRFKMDGVPALLVYKGGQVIGNFVRVTDDLGEVFYPGDVENFLIEHGMMVDRCCVPSIMEQVEASS